MTGRMEMDNKIEVRCNKLLEDCPDYVSEWFENLKANSMTSQTCFDYLNNIRKMILWYPEYPETIKQLSQKRTIEFFNASKKRYDEYEDEEIPVAISSQQALWSALKNFFEYLCNMDYIKDNYMRTIKRPRTRDGEESGKEKVFLTQTDFNKLIKVIDRGAGTETAKKHQSHTRSRDKLIMLLFMTTGMRESALCSINLNDINIEKCQLTVIDKGNKHHYYSLTDDVMKAMNEWLVDRESKCNTCNALFIGNFDQRITPMGITMIIKKFSKAALGRAISPHKLRAGFCSILYSKTHDIEFVRRSVGHSQTQTTQRYIVTDNKERKEASEIIGNLLKF